MNLFVNSLVLLHNSLLLHYRVCCEGLWWSQWQLDSMCDLGKPLIFYPQITRWLSPDLEISWDEYELKEPLSQWSRSNAAEVKEVADQRWPAKFSRALLDTDPHRGESCWATAENLVFNFNWVTVVKETETELGVFSCLQQTTITAMINVCWVIYYCVIHYCNKNTFKLKYDNCGSTVAFAKYFAR